MLLFQLESEKKKKKERKKEKVVLQMRTCDWHFKSNGSRTS